jgi:hypothetical protein
MAGKYEIYYIGISDLELHTKPPPSLALTLKIHS